MRKIVIPTALQTMADIDKLDMFRDAFHNYETTPGPETLSMLEECLRTFANHRGVGGVAEGRDLRGLNLSGVRFGLSMTRVILEKANMEACSAYHTSFSHAVMSGATMRSSVFENVQFVGAAMHSCDMRGARFSKCQFDGAQMMGCDLRGAIFHHCTFRLVDLGKSEVDPTTFFDSPYDWNMCLRVGVKGMPVVKSV